MSLSITRMWTRILIVSGVKQHMFVSSSVWGLATIQRIIDPANSVFYGVIRANMYFRSRTSAFRGFWTARSISTWYSPHSRYSGQWSWNLPLISYSIRYTMCSVFSLICFSFAALLCNKLGLCFVIFKYTIYQRFTGELFASCINFEINSLRIF